jgi:hypothetical protein
VNTDTRTRTRDTDTDRTRDTDTDHGLVTTVKGLNELLVKDNSGEPYQCHKSRGPNNAAFTSPNHALTNSNSTQYHTVEMLESNSEMSIDCSDSDRPSSERWDSSGSMCCSMPKAPLSSAVSPPRMPHRSIDKEQVKKSLPLVDLVIETPKTQGDSSCSSMPLVSVWQQQERTVVVPTFSL